MTATAHQTPSPATVPDGDWRARLRASRFGTLAVLALTLAVVLGAAWAVNRPVEDNSDGGVSTVTLTGDRSGPAPKVGQPAPDFSATTIDGKQVRLSELKGRPVWVTFGASWCTACRTEAPDIEAVYGKSRPAGLEIVSVYINESAPNVQDYTQRLGLTMPAVVDQDTKVASAYRVLGIPAHYYIDSSGVLRATQVGSMSEAKMTEQVRRIGG
ncbi:redoxin domain-containing protein [Actinomycetota bacterium]